MAIKSSSATVTSTAAKVNTTAETDADTGTSIIVRNPTAGTTVYAGPAGVTSATGFAILGGERLELDLDHNESLYLVTASGTQAVAILERGV